MQEIRIQSLGQEDPLRRKWQPTPVFLLEKSHGQRSLIGHSPWVCKELDTAEQLSIHTHPDGWNTSQVDEWYLPNIDFTMLRGNIWKDLKNNEIPFFLHRNVVTYCNYSVIIWHCLQPMQMTRKKLFIANAIRQEKRWVINN